MSEESQTGEPPLEAVIRDTLEQQFGTDVDISAYSQGDAIDVHVEFPDVDQRLVEATGVESVQTYSKLKFTIPRR